MVLESSVAFVESAGFGAEFVEDQPFLVAALFPFGEVLFVDPVSVEVGFEDWKDFRVAVEPLDELDGGFSIEEPLIEFLPDVERETCDLTFACSHNLTFRVLQCRLPRAAFSPTEQPYRDLSALFSI